MTEWRVVVFQEKGYWVAVCLENDIVAQAATLADLKCAFAAVAKREAELAMEHGQKPFTGLSAAPSKYHEMFERAERLAEPVRIVIPGANSAEIAPAQFAIAA